VIIKSGKAWYVVGENGKRLGGPYYSLAAAQKRLAQIEYFKHRSKRR
jgi:hypothetical protein